MKYTRIIIVGILILFIIFLLIKQKFRKPELSEQNENPQIFFKLRDNCEYKMIEALTLFFNRNNIKDIKKGPLTDKKIIFVPCIYDSPDKEISGMPKTKDNYYMILNNCDEIVGKNFLWKYLYDYYGNNVTKYLPKSYLPYDNNSMKEFMNDFKEGKLYIMKKNMQRQEGIVISSNLNEITTKIKEKDANFAIIQELLQNPYLVNGRKINLRVYVLLVIKNNEYSIYVYDDGFMYYTPKMFVKNSTDIDTNITTGYIDRKVYEENPLTHGDFKKFLGEQKSQIIFQNIRNLIKDILEPYRKLLVSTQSFPNSTQFQIFGADVAVNEDMTSTIMEINKGPDLTPKDARDGELKKKLMDDAFSIINIIKGDGNNKFIKVN
jgi:hypothetical protein